jgi:serine/threonine protein kinase
MEYGMANLTKYRGLGKKDEKKPAESKERLQLTHNFLIDMSKALQYLKEMNVNHRDIKLENFVTVETSDKPVVKLIDFGISTRCPGTYQYNKDDKALSIGDEDGGKQKIFEVGGGTQFYVAPENVRERSYDTHKGDIFAFGICILELFYPHEPKHLRTPLQILLNMQPIKTRIEKNFPKIAGDITGFYNDINKYVFNDNPIIQQILDPNPTNRTDIESVLRELNKSLTRLENK